MIALLLSLALASSADPIPPLATRAGATAAKPAAAGADEAAVRALDEAFVTAFNKKDAAGIAAYYADGAVAMDPGPAMWSRGKDEIQKNFTSLFADPDAIELKLHDSTYHVHGDFAWTTTLFTFKSTDSTGKVTSSEGRAVSVFEKKDGKWKCVADHASMPVAPPPPASAAPAAMPPATKK